MPARVRFIDPDFRRVSAGPLVCVVCGRNVKRGYRMVRLLDGGMFVLHPEARESFSFKPGVEVQSEPGEVFALQDDCGDQPIGPDCAVTIGLEWSWEP